MLVQLVVTAPDTIDDASRLLARDLAELDLACSRFRPDSEVASIGRAASRATGAYTTSVSPLLAEAIAVALRAASLTDGDVDPTVGAAMCALGYDRDFALVPPTGPALAAVWRRVDGGGQVSAAVVPGWRSVGLDVAAGQLTILAGTQLDLGATVKGWAADRSASRIAAQLGCGVLVSLGGDTATAGQPPDGGWRIRVQEVTGTPGGPGVGGPATVVAINGGGLAISSAVARRWRRGGVMFHHILDPRTALPAAPVWRDISVVAANCADANTAATAAIIRGQQAAAWLASLSLPARLVAADGSVHTVGGWPADGTATRLG
ncbi:MAG TPA: FAD:protein FMN transferase [Trebonia sp.]|jgi:thiamine biosynthesis lipoprotein|nr:FAD:protein FMN transferase [Trebonia sp.]